MEMGCESYSPAALSPAREMLQVEVVPTANLGD
jgi:hypothetical protein